MIKVTQKSVFTTLILAGLAVAVGCGDGSKHHTRVPRDTSASAKVGANGKVVTSAPGTPGAVVPKAGDASAAGGDRKATGDGSSLPQVLSDTDKTTETKINNLVADDKKAQPTSLAALDAGIYVLQNIITHFEYAPSAGAFAQTYADRAFDGTALTAPVPNYSYGIMNDSDDGRYVLFPTKFEIDAKGTQLDPTKVFEVVMNVISGLDASKKLVNQDSIPSGTPRLPGKDTDLDVMKLLAGDTKAKVTIEPGLTDGIFRILISIDEQTIDEKAKPSQTGGKFRHIVLNYKRTDLPAAAAAAQAPAAPAPADPAAPAAPAADAPAK